MSVKNICRNYIYKVFFLTVALGFSLLLGCETKSKSSVASKEIFAMDTYMDIICYGSSAEDAIYQCEKEISRLSGLFDAVSGDGDVARINQNGSATVSDDTVQVIRVSKEISKSTDHAFHILIKPLVSLWGFATDAPHVPDDSEIQALLPLPDADTISVSSNTVTMPEKAAIDLGGIAKGYLSDRLSEIVRSSGVTSALLSLGGNVMAVGTKEDGSDWNIGIRDPKDEFGVIGVVSVHDMAVITSGSYQRYFEEDGKIYHHILDPKTGYPAESGLVSVTVVSKNGASADALSTAFFVLGTEKSIEIISNLKDEYRPNGVIFIEENDTVRIWGNIAFHAIDSNLKVEVIS